MSPSNSAPGGLCSQLFCGPPNRGPSLHSGPHAAPFPAAEASPGCGPALPRTPGAVQGGGEDPQLRLSCRQLGAGFAAEPTRESLEAAAQPRWGAEFQLMVFNFYWFFLSNFLIRGCRTCLHIRNIRSFKYTGSSLTASIGPQKLRLYVERRVMKPVVPEADDTTEGSVAAARFRPPDVTQLYVKTPHASHGRHELRARPADV